MVPEDWLRVPVGPDAERWVTAGTERTVVAVMHSVAGAGHLLDAVELLECDQRVQVVYTQGPSPFSNGVAALLRELGAVVIPWRQAVRCRFDLAIATQAAGLHELSAPILHLAHGVMNNKRAPVSVSGPDSDQVIGLGTSWLTWNGRLVPAAVALSHVDLIGVLARQCAPALSVAKVVGDLCLDRLAASRAMRTYYREALGVVDGQAVVAVCSTWGPQSLFARYPTMPGDLLAALPRQRYAVLMGLHPAAWFGHGARQVLAWLREPRRVGLRVCEPIHWRGLVAAADLVIGDHGSSTLYAAAAGVPVLRAPWANDSVRTGSAVAALAKTAPMLAETQPLQSQVDAAMASDADQTRRSVAERVTSHPGEAARLLRTETYRLLNLAEPSGAAETTPVTVARLAGEEGS